VPYFVTDEKDLTSCVTGMFSSSKANRPCNLCTHVFKGTSDIATAGPRRTVQDMMEVRSTKLSMNAFVMPIVDAENVESGRKATN
jgi:hypothetical protein